MQFLHIWYAKIAHHDRRHYIYILQIFFQKQNKKNAAKYITKGRTCQEQAKKQQLCCCFFVPSAFLPEPALCDAKKLLFFLFFLFFSVFFEMFCKIGESGVINSLSTAKAILTPVKTSENLHQSPLWCRFFGTNVLYKVTYLCKYYAETKRKGKGGCAPKSPALTRLRFGGTPPLFPTVTHSVKKELTYWVKYAIMKAADGNGNHQPKGMLSGLVSSKAFCTNADIRVIANACACVSPKSHNTALEAMKTCQVDIL